MAVHYDPNIEVSTMFCLFVWQMIGARLQNIMMPVIDLLVALSHLAFPRAAHLKAVYILFGYLKQVPKRQLHFDPNHPDISENLFHKYDCEDFYVDADETISLDMPWPRGKTVTSHCLVNVNHAGDKATRRSMTGILIFCNRAPIICHTKRQNIVETSIFGS